MKRCIAVDFDGTLCENKYPKIGTANTALIEQLKEEKKKWDGTDPVDMQTGEAAGGRSQLVQKARTDFQHSEPKPEGKDQGIPRGHAENQRGRIH